MPPQYGKSQLISRYTPSYYLGQFPDDHFLHGSYETEFAKGWGAKARDIFESYNHDIFGVTLSKTSSSKGHWEVQGKEGSYDAFGMNGAATGKPGDFINIDDPHKGRLDASSPAYQKRAYETYTDVIETRLSKKGVINLTQTRWDVKDLAGRILDKEPSVNFEDVYQDLLAGREFEEEWVILKFPAIAKENDILGRKEGDPLCEDLHPLRQVLATKKRRTAFSWASLFQCEPIPFEGSLFKYDFFEIIPTLTVELENKVRQWDLAGTRKKYSAYTAGEKCGKSYNNDFFVLNEVRIKESPGAVRSKVVSTATTDTYDTKIRIFRDPGQAAIDQMAQYAKRLPGFNFKDVVESELGSKEQRAELLATHGELNKIYIVEDTFGKQEDIDEFIEEHIEFPRGKYKDRVDANSGAFLELFHLDPNKVDEAVYSTGKKKYASKKQDNKYVSRAAMKRRNRR